MADPGGSLVTGWLKQQAPSAVKPCLKKKKLRMLTFGLQTYTQLKTPTHTCVCAHNSHTHTNTRKYKTQKQVFLFNTRSLDESSELSIAFALLFFPHPPVSWLTRMHFSLRVQTSGLIKASRARSFSFPGRKPHLGTMKKMQTDFVTPHQRTGFPPGHPALHYHLSSPACLFPSKAKGEKQL